MQANQDWEAFAEESIARLLKYESHPDLKLFATDPCNMYSLEIDGRIASKGELVVDFSLEAIEAFLVDPQTQKKMANNLESVTILKEGQGFKITLMKYSATWPVSPRDFVMGACRRRVGNKLFITSRSINYPCAEESGVVRGEAHIGGYIIESLGANKSKVTYVSDADLKGSIPGMIKTKLSKGQAEIPSKLNKLLIDSKK